MIDVFEENTCFNMNCSRKETWDLYFMAYDIYDLVISPHEQLIFNLFHSAFYI